MFLVRDSVHFQGDCTLSVAIEGRVDHYRILHRGGMQEVDGGDCSFHSLIDLVQVLGASLPPPNPTCLPARLTTLCLHGVRTFTAVYP